MRRVHRRDGGARARGGRRPRARAAARRQDPRAGRGRRAGAGGDRRLLRRQLAVGRRRGHARSWARSPTRASATPAGRSASAAADGASNQEGVYWRYELGAARAGVAAVLDHGGQRRDLRDPRERYIVVDPIMGHDLSLPFNMVKRGLRAVYVPAARAREKMVPSLEGEFARKRRMMSHTWPIVLRGGMLSPRGYPPAYALMIFSHRLLRYSTPGAARARARGERRAGGARRGDALRGHARTAARAAGGAPRSPASLPRARAADRALLRADHRLLAPPACGTGCATARPPRGRPRRGRARRPPLWPL